MDTKKPPAPWRKVVKYYAAPWHMQVGRYRSAMLTLECGHEVLLRGEAASDGKYTKRKRCHDCASGFPVLSHQRAR